MKALKLMTEPGVGINLDEGNIGVELKRVSQRNHTHTKKKHIPVLTMEP